ncbi:hypothetical protein [Enterocloster asparagiformis]|uniref:Uncharacterized protein n=1 Tax=[Clostridium] asparagiforme DSM 15981 TaxID=518636 RepID=C0CWE6_9FIRM|nr:hypothetical protein CLOSTASPAR_01312 [[Clostridium] asparagiforme DSM 15981]
MTLTMMSTCLMGSTMARYVTEVTGSATAAVAAWSFKADSKDSVGETFTEIYLGDTTHREAYDLKDIAEGVIAPGTKGSFDIVIDGAGSGVGIDYAVKIAAGKDVILPDDLVFSTEAITADKPGSKLDDFSPSGTIDYAAGADSMKKTITVNWEWAFGEDDTAEENKNDNKSADNDWLLNIAITGKQTTPETTTATP